MIIEFTDTIPAHSNALPIVISGNDSLHLHGRQYIVITNDDGTVNVYEIRYAIHCSPFKEALLIDHLLAVGYEEYFYLFDVKAGKNILALQLNGYFGDCYLNKQLLYVTDAVGIYCIDLTGAIRWQNNNLAIDGIMISDFTDTQLSGSAECDPPGGWKDFVVDIQTGVRLQ